MDAQLTARAPKANRSKAKDDKPPGFSTDIVEECLRKYATPADREKLKDLKPFMFAALPESVLRAMQLSERLIQAHSETTKTLSRWLVNYSAARGASGSGGGDDDDDDDDDALPSKRSKSPDYAYRTEAVPAEKLLRATRGCKLGANCCPRPFADRATRGRAETRDPGKAPALRDEPSPGEKRTGEGPSPVGSRTGSAVSRGRSDKGPGALPAALALDRTASS
ncbi:hypothetical protein Q5P01_000806 [Channa striata]|uniref:Uncharacterized protein n=1 Tax=Channa striata TaxID=64152 RepID=A0AA88IIA1_CHASR|nr:hypothetical protein Q5P01_000806 [Channa striata]